MLLNKIKWRTVRDSNPRDGFPPTHFPGVRLRPLGQLSQWRSYLLNLKNCNPLVLDFSWLNKSISNFQDF